MKEICMAGKCTGCKVCGDICKANRKWTFFKPQESVFYSLRMKQLEKTYLYGRKINDGDCWRRKIWQMD